MKENSQISLKAVLSELIIKHWNVIVQLGKHNAINVRLNYGCDKRYVLDEETPNNLQL
jgi:hypothetical protein